jgi:molybdopterin synthase catalytic subunit
MIDTRICETAFDPYAELACFQADARDCGALASFIGFCRATSGVRAVTHLELQQFAPFSGRELYTLVSDIARSHDVAHALVIHRVGRIEAGEPIVLVAARAAHRVEALTAVGGLIDALKVAAPLWKREFGPDGARWIDPTEEDLRRIAALRLKS